MIVTYFKNHNNKWHPFWFIVLLVIIGVLTVPQGSNNDGVIREDKKNRVDSSARNIPSDTGQDSSAQAHDTIGKGAQNAGSPIDSLLRRQCSDSSALAYDADSGIVMLDSMSRSEKDSTGSMTLKPIRPSWLYSGIALDQDSLARRMLAFFYRFDWHEADKISKKMQRLEKKRRLPPLSYLLMVGIRVIRLQNGEYPDDRTAKELLRETKKLSKRGLLLADPEKADDTVRATNLFIGGGIKGFLATLEIDKNPINAALSGFAAKKQLEEALACDSSIIDAWLGLGLFNCALAKAPLLVRGALMMIGKEVSLRKGQNYLKRSAYRGRYTNDIAKLYLVQFYSPYWGHEAAEKRRMFHALQRDYPANPLYLFLELEEDLCFHPGTLFRFSYKSRIRKQMVAFKTDNYETRRYAQLVKWQYLLIDPFPSRGMVPDPSFDLRGFSYYPIFLRALREKHVYEREGVLKGNDRMSRLKYIRTQALEATRILEASTSLSASRKSYFLWHIRDALGFSKESEGDK